VFPTAPDPRCAVSVVVPVRDEAATLGDSLRALAHQVDDRGRPLDAATYEVLVLANNCRDESARVCRQVARRHPWLRLHLAEVELPTAEAHVGGARRLVMDQAFYRLVSRGRDRGVIASTDGDTRVAATWLAEIRAAVAAGADAVAGRIFIDHEGLMGLPPGTRRSHLKSAGYEYLLAEYAARTDPLPWDPWPGHHQHYGASLAVTVAAYRRAGGVPDVPDLEDIALCRSLLRVDARVRHSPRVRAWTSGRLHGRASRGLSWQLREWTGMAVDGRGVLVEHPRTTGTRLRLRRELRLCWLGRRVGVSPAPRQVATLADLVGGEPAWLADRLATTPTFGALYEGVEEAAMESGAAPPWPAVPIDEAIRELRSRCHRLRLRATSDCATLQT